ncbi:MAG: precorrin-4 C(11)-methyltransferase [Chloroflexi bacterium]|nr:precorrin-4 C(11)-methyltransferase [Chloroflexota bacterium]MCL5109345.1 precorrin-4 C(11)-methyltransferase [Chloroflexota bacterium]
METERQPAVYFIGAGPGALDLLTLRAERLLRRADLILYADSLVNPEITTLAKPGAKVIGTASLALDEIVGLMVEAVGAGRLVARVHSGDPSLYGAIREQMVALRAAGVTYAVVPGVSSLFGAAAALGVELTCPEVSQTVIISRVAGRTPVPEREDLPALATHGTTLVLFLSVAQIDEVVSQLREGGYAADTPAAVVYRATWPDQQIVQAELSALPTAVRASGITHQALILVGDALQAGPGSVPQPASRLYDPSFGHGWRAPRPGRRA